MQPSKTEIIFYGNSAIDCDTRCVFVAGRREFLAPMEFVIFQLLLSGKPIQKEWNKSLPVHLCRIRKKLKTVQSNIAIKAIRDRGYYIFVEASEHVNCE